jgi:membrane-bound serine protease (ClpP class)
VLRASLDGVVNSGTSSYLIDTVARAEKAHCAAVLVVLDTPGGMLDATRDIVRAFLQAKVPIIVYVAPAGARAGSAGVFITLAAHVAAMAPGTNIGAAHPISGGGEDPEKSGGKHLAEKIENDTAALARSIAKQRGRNSAWAEAAVRDSIAATADEALEEDVIDFMAPSEHAVLKAATSRTVPIRGRSVTLDLEQVRIQDSPMTLQQRTLAVLGHPNLAYLLLTIGMLGLMIELYHPGVFVAGAVGVLALLLAAIGLNALPVNVGAVVLMVVAVGLLVAEAYVTSFGLLALSGVGLLVLASTLLIDRSAPDFLVDRSLGVSWSVTLPLALVLGASAMALAWRAIRGRSDRQQAGAEALVGQKGVALTDITNTEGYVRVHGERWRATSRQPLASGARVRVISVHGLELEVTALDDEPSRYDSLEEAT